MDFRWILFLIKNHRPTFFLKSSEFSSISLPSVSNKRYFCVFKAKEFNFNSFFIPKNDDVVSVMTWDERLLTYTLVLYDFVHQILI